MIVILRSFTLNKSIFFLFSDNSYCGILINVACQLRENPELIFSTDERRNSPYIVANKRDDQDHLDQFILDERTKFEVVVDGEIIGKSEDFFSAFALYMASFYVFNVAYPKDFENTLIFIQKLFLEILDDGLKAPSRVLTLISKVKNSL